MHDKSVKTYEIRKNNKNKRQTRTDKWTDIDDRGRGIKNIKFLISYTI